MKNDKVLEAFKLRENGYSLRQIEQATGIKKPYLSFLFQNFSIDEIEKANQKIDVYRLWDNLDFSTKYNLASNYIWWAVIITLIVLIAIELIIRWI